MTQINPKDSTLRDKIARIIKDEIGADIGAEVYGFEDAANAIIAALPDVTAGIAAAEIKRLAIWNARTKRYENVEPFHGLPERTKP